VGFHDYEVDPSRFCGFQQLLANNREYIRERVLEKAFLTFMKFQIQSYLGLLLSSSQLASCNDDGKLLLLVYKKDIHKC